jgi:hypothetical protein
MKASLHSFITEAVALYRNVVTSVCISGSFLNFCGTDYFLRTLLLIN